MPRCEDGKFKEARDRESREIEDRRLETDKKNQITAWKRWKEKKNMAERKLNVN